MIDILSELKKNKIPVKKYWINEAEFGESIVGDYVIKSDKNTSNFYSIYKYHGML